MEVTCPHCSAVFTVPDTVKTVTCPYCGLVFHIGEEGKYEVSKVDHYYFPLDERDPYELLLKFVSRQYGSPADIASASSLTKRVLHYVPVYFFYLHGSAIVKPFLSNRRTRVEVVKYLGIPAIGGKLGLLLEDYPFPIRGKRFFEEDVKRAGVFHEPLFDAEEAKKKAEFFLTSALLDEARKSCSSISDLQEESKNVEYRGLVHYPVWELAYTYKGETYEGWIDGADGRIILVEHPITVAIRATQIAIGIGLITAGLVVGGFTSIIFHSILGIVGGIAAGFAGAIQPLIRSVEVKVKASQVRELGGTVPAGFTKILKTSKIFFRIGI